MNIATALNKKYINYTIVMLNSLCSNNPEHIDAYLLSSELGDLEIQYMQECLKDFDISLILYSVDRTLFDERLPRNTMWSIETYYRLLLLDLLPVTVERLLYLDVDVIVNKSLKELYEVEMGEDEIITCIDSCGKLTWDKRSDKQREMFAPMIEMGYQYFCAGVMLLNIALIRKNYNFEKYMEAVREWNYEMSAPDQDILNYCHWQHVGYVDPMEYDLFARVAHNMNMSYEDVRLSAYIIHYAGDKPWQAGNVHFDIEKLWWDYAKQTPCYHELLEAFVLDTLHNTQLEEYINSLMKDRDLTKMELEKSLQINNKLLNLLDRK